MKKIIYVLVIFLIIVSCEKDKQTTSPITITPCLNDSTINNVGKYVFVRYYRDANRNYTKVYLDTTEVFISHSDCKTLTISSLTDYKFVFENTSKNFGTYLGKNYCACSYELTLLNKNNIYMFERCGGQGSPCANGIVIRYYDGYKIE